MIIEALKPLLESGLLNKETQQAISEAWENKINESKTEIRNEIRNEFAERYAHDKATIEESLDKMVNETLQNQINEVKKEKAAIQKDRVNKFKEMQETAKAFKNFLTQTLAEEIQEFRKDKQAFKNGHAKLEKFVISALAEEITEFATDKKDLASTKVKLVSEAKSQLDVLKKKFVARSSKLVEKAVTQQLKKELTQLHEDISAAKKNNFGRKIFETYATEFAASFLNENAEIRKVNAELVETKKKLAESRKSQIKAKQLIESKNQEIKNIGNDAKRKTIVNELLSTLTTEKKEVMTQLLEGVQTDKLRTAFDKYLPAVLDNSGKKKVLSESKTVAATGNKNMQTKNEDNNDNVIDIKRLAGL